MSTLGPEYVDIRGTGVVERWYDQLQGLFANMYGPRSGLKLVKKDEEWSVVADAGTLLSTLSVVTPMTDLWSSLVEGQTDRYGDGSTFAALFALELAQVSMGLVGSSLHPTTIERGYRHAYETARERIETLGVTRSDQDILQSTLEGVAAGDGIYEHPAVGAMTRIVRADESSFSPQILARNRGTARETRAVPGVLVTKAPADDSRLPVTDARVLLVDERLYVEEETEEDSHSRTAPTVVADSPETVRRAEDTIADLESAWADRILSVDPDLVVTRKGLAERIRRRLLRADLTLLHRAKPDEALARLAASTGAAVVSHVEDVTEDHLGLAGRVELCSFNDLDYVLVHGRPSGPWSLLVGNWTWQTTELVEDAVDSLVTVGRQATSDPTFVPGGGATDVHLASVVRDDAQAVADRQQLAVTGYADALESTVRTLARNLGHDPVGTLASLRAGEAGVGLIADRDEVGDALDAGVADLATVKRGALTAATNTALTLLRVDALVSTDA
jgi:chaperonin GroEL (HSP60 family)